MLSTRQRDILIYWLPPVIASFIAWCAFLTIGGTPLIRATGLALVIAGVTLTLRQWGTVQSIVGGLALAFSSAFWSQTSNLASTNPVTIVFALIAAAVVVLFVMRFKSVPYLAIGIGLLVFALIFWVLIGTPRSLRLTGLLSAWLLFLLVDAIRITNPRPDEPPALPIDRQHTFGLLILMTVGILNDPLFVLIMPAVVLGLWLSWTPLPRWYWLALLGLIIIGGRGLVVTYISGDWWASSALDLHVVGGHFPYLVADGWREGERWIDLIRIITNQFTVFGAGLSVLGLARMARWYPILGIVTMVAYGAYALFGLMYFGEDRAALLLPLFIIQVIWLTYAIHALGQWLDKTLTPTSQIAHRSVTIAYMLLPLLTVLSKLE